MEYIIRKKEQKDCAAIAHVVTIAWNETYQGIVPTSFLKELYNNEEQRANNSFLKFTESNNHQYVLEVANRVVGFVNVGPSNDKDYQDCGELQAIYIMSAYKGQGFGKKLFETGIKELKQMGFNKMIIGCLDGNPSNNFYQHLGGKFVKKRIFEKLQLVENVYYFSKI
jgi:GNAT superfamily N-acetyltransferase